MLGGLAPTQLSGAAQSELMDLCEQQFAQLEKVKAEWKPQQSYEVVQTWTFSVLQLQNEIILCESDFSDRPQEQVGFRFVRCVVVTAASGLGLCYKDSCKILKDELVQKCYFGTYQ